MLLDAPTLANVQRVFGTTDPRRVQVLRQPLFDYVFMPAAGTNKVQFLVNTSGQSDPSNSGYRKTDEDTNMPASANLGNQAFLLREIRTHISPVPKARQPAGISDQASILYGGYTSMQNALMSLAQNGVLRMQLNGKDYVDVETPFKNCPPGFGVEVNQHAAKHTTGALWVTQSNDDANVWKVFPQIFIDPNMTIDLWIEFPFANSPAWSGNQVNATTPLVQAGVILDGLMIKPAS